MENSTIFFILLAVFGTIWYVIKTPFKIKEEVKDDNINRNIQSINKMGYIPEEDDELDGFEQVEKPHIEIYGYKSELTDMIFTNIPDNPNDRFTAVDKDKNIIKQVEKPTVHLRSNEVFKERYERLKKAGYYANDHVQSVID